MSPTADIMAELVNPAGFPNIGFCRSPSPLESLGAAILLAAYGVDSDGEPFITASGAEFIAGVAMVLGLVEEGRRPDTISLAPGVEQLVRAIVARDKDLIEPRQSQEGRDG